MHKLPVSGDTHDQERRSIRAFLSILPDNLFIFRSEDGGDYGADKILELKILERYVSNFRVYFQIKSIEDSKRNKDGTFSYAISISTLNYLANQPNSLFLIYLENEKKFVWDWVFNIIRFANEKGLNLNDTEQESLTYRFLKVLDRESFESIFERAMKTSIITRDICNLVSSSDVPTKTLTAFIDTESAKVTSPEENIRNLKKYGISLANDGRYDLIEKLLQSLPASSKNDPDLATVVAYIKFNNGAIYDAFSWLPRGYIKENISDDYKDLAMLIELNLNYLLGIILYEQYLDHLESLEQNNPDSVIILQQKLFKTRDYLIRADETLQKEYVNYMEEYRNTVEKLLTLTAEKTVLELIVKIVDWEVEGYLLLRKLNKHFYLISGRELIGKSLTLDKRLALARETVEEHTQWFKRFQSLYKEIKADQQKALSIISYANLQMQFISVLGAMNDSDSDDPRKILEGIKDNLIWGLDVLGKNGYIQEYLRGCISLANCLHGLGEKEEAVLLVQKTKKQAETYGLQKIIQAAESFLSGEIIFDIKLLLDKVQPTLIGLSEEELHKYARQTAQMMELPEDRLPNLVIDYKWLQLDELVRVDFCEYLHTLQDLRHSSSLETAYSINPDRKFKCVYYGYESPYPGTDRDRLLQRFKSDYCLGCSMKKTDSRKT